MKIPDTPFTILALGPFALTTGAARSLPAATLNDALAALTPEIWVPLAKELCPAGGVLIKPRRMKDFTPDGMVETVPHLKDLADCLTLIDEAPGRGLSHQETGGLLRERLPGISIDFSYQAPDTPKKGAGNAVDDILSMVAMPEKGAAHASPAEGNGPRAWRKEIDSLLSATIEAIFADEPFRAFEGAWRGMETIMKQGPAGEGKDTRLTFAPVTHDTLPATLDLLQETLAGSPPNLVIIDLPFDNSPASVESMEKVALFADTLLAPTALWLTPRFLNLDEWEGLGRLSFLATYTDNAAYAKWKNLRSLPEARWLGALCNRFLARSPYGEENKPRTVSFTERFLPWVSPVYALAALAARSTAAFGSASRLTDSTHIMLEDCGLQSLGPDMRVSTEAMITTDRMRQFADIGVTPLMGTAMRDVVHMPSAVTVSGDSLPFQIFFSSLVGFLAALREWPEFSAKGDDPAEGVQEALALYLGKAGHGVPPDLEVTSGEPGSDGSCPLFIAFTPSHDILRGTGRLTFTYAW